LPEITLRRLLPAVVDWHFTRTILSADALETAFTLDPIAWRAVDRDNTGRPIQYDIDGDQGTTLRFGDGVFGAAPASGDYFSVAYRMGLGAQGNVAADSITTIDPAWTGLITSARNPFAVTDGADAETAEHIRRMAPQAFRTVQYRAVRGEDYEAAAETLPWVQKAGTSFRWTGSWLTVFTAVDPLGGERTTADEHGELVDLLKRRRLAGYESYAPQPHYVSIDLRIEICVAPLFLPGDAEHGVLDRLGSAQRPDGSTGFFFADRFTFGTPLYRSRLEAAIQSVPGVTGVLSITFRRRGSINVFTDLPPVLRVGNREILRVDNDPDWPERGTIRVIPLGGR
jgi:predicted phage baseplate assembly protein